MFALNWSPIPLEAGLCGEGSIAVHAWVKDPRPHIGPKDLPEVIMKEGHISRRKFLQTSAGAAGALLASRTVFLDPDSIRASPVPASDRIRFGMIGVGMQGSGLLAAAIELPGVECAAACDLYDGRHTLAKESSTLTCRPPAGTRNCCRTKTSIASLLPSRITGTSRSSWMQ